MPLSNTSTYLYIYTIHLLRSTAWPNKDLNNICVHPDLIDACQRIIGTENIRLCKDIVA